MSHTTTLWLFFAALIALGLVDESLLELLPVLDIDYSLASSDLLEELEEAKAVFSRTGIASLVGLLLGGLIGDKQFRGQHLHTVGLWPSIVLSAALFATSTFFISEIETASYIALSLYYLTSGLAYFWLFAAASSTGGTATETLRIFILLTAVSPYISNIATPTFSSVAGINNENTQYYVFAWVCAAIVLATPVVFLRLQPNRPTETEEDVLVFFPKIARHRKAQNLGVLIFLFSLSATLSTLELFPSYENRDTFFATVGFILLAIIPATYLILKLAKTGRVTAQTILLYGAWMLVSVSLVIILATALQFFLFAQLLLVTTSLATVFLGAAIFALWSGIAREMQLTNSTSNHAKHMLLYFLILKVGGFSGLTLKWAIVASEIDRAMMAASISTIIWTLFLITVLSLGDSMLKRNTSNGC